MALEPLRPSERGPVASRPRVSDSPVLTTERFPRRERIYPRSGIRPSSFGWIPPAAGGEEDVDPIAQLDAAFVNMTLEFSRFLPELFSALGGETRG